MRSLPVTIARVPEIELTLPHLKSLVGTWAVNRNSIARINAMALKLMNDKEAKGSLKPEHVKCLSFLIRAKLYASQILSS